MIQLKAARKPTSQIVSEEELNSHEEWRRKIVYIKTTTTTQITKRINENGHRAKNLSILSCKFMRFYFIFRIYAGFSRGYENPIKINIHTNKFCIKLIFGLHLFYGRRIFVDLMGRYQLYIKWQFLIRVHMCRSACRSLSLTHLCVCVCLWVVHESIRDTHLHHPFLFARTTENISFVNHCGALHWYVI